MGLCKDCVKGVVHEGNSTGTWEFIDGVECYVTSPPEGEYDKDTVVLFLSDLFGPKLPNNQLLADSFAQNGYKTIIPDYFNGDAVQPEAMDPGSTFDLMGWIAKHGQAETRPTLDKVVQALQASGVTKFAAAGYCFGARYAFDLAFDEIVKVNAIAHASLLEIPADLEKYRDTAKAPLLINSCEFDPPFNHEAQATADKVFKDFGPGYKREYFEGVSHGFTVRGDLNDPKIKESRERSFEVTIEWFRKYL